MIIRLTVKDNDFYNVMNAFIKRFPLIITSIPNDLGLEESLKLIERMNHIDRLLNPNTTETLDESDKQLIIEQIKIAFFEFVNKNVYSKDYVEYLKNNFEVEILNFMEDKWENGEVWYWFQNSGSFLNQ